MKIENSPVVNPILSWRESNQRYKYLGDTGTIISLTQIETPVAGFESQTPYYVAIIKLTKDIQVTGQLVESIQGTPVIGDCVIGVLRRIGQAKPEEIIEYGVKWKVIK